MKLFRTLPLAVALAISPVPAMAQDFGDIFGGATNPITMFKELFEVEPLTAAEEARLPAGQQVANSLLPPGAYGKAIEDAFTPMAGKIMDMVEPNNAARVAKLAGVSASALEGLDQTKLDGIVALLDPQADERNKKIVDFVFAEVAGAMVKIEPFYREGMARAYAKHYDAAQLAEINAFFATPTGNLYASRSMAMYMDPQVMATIPDMIPVMVGHVAEAATRFVLELDTIPVTRDVDALGAGERTQLLRLLGMTEDEYTAATQAEALDFDWEDETCEEIDYCDGTGGDLDETPIIGGLEPVD